MSKYAHLPQIASGVVFSDPWYKEDVWCQYRKAFQDTNWFLKLDSHLGEGEYGSLNFQVVMGRPTIMSSVRCEESQEGITVFSPMRYRVDQVELGIDTAKIFCGSLEDFEKYGETIAFRTGGDGMFGDLFVFTPHGDDQPAGFALFCAFDPDFMTENNFFNHLIASFYGKELSNKEFQYGISPNNIGNKILLANEENQAAKANIHKDTPREKGTPEPER